MSWKTPETASHQLNAGMPFHLTGLVDYVPGSIVSRILHKGPAGVVTVMAFEAGEEVSEHTTPCDAFAVILDGTAELKIDGAPVRAAAGEMVKLPADVPHSLRAAQRFKVLLIMLRS